jgi:protein-S-isoprenylcysteine O-methyltransferase Ste14
MTVFRWLALAILLGAISVSGFHRRQARRGSEPIPRRKEGSLFMALRAAATVPLLLAILAHVFLPAWMEWATFPASAWLRGFGVVLGLTCIAGASWVLRALGRNVSETVLTKPDQELVTSGPYRRVRHPLITTGLLLIGAVGLMLGSWLVLACDAVVLFLIRYLVIPREELALAERFGPRYIAYQQASGRLEPRLIGRR